MKITYDKNGIKVLPPQPKSRFVKPCWKEKLTQEKAEARAFIAYDVYGNYEAYQCPNDSTHWHTGHHPLFEVTRRIA